MDQNIVSIIGIIIILLLFVNTNNLVNINKLENFKPNSTMDRNKSIIDYYLDYNKKIYGYIFKKQITDRNRNNVMDIQPLTVKEYYNKIESSFKELFALSKCGYVYNYYENQIVKPGAMYLVDDGIAIYDKDLNNKEGIFDAINNNLTLVISEGDITYQISKNNIIADPITNIITVFIEPKTFKGKFKVDTRYILYPCSTYEHIENAPTPINPNPIGGDSSVNQSIIDTNVNNTFLIYIGLLFFIALVYNWKYFYNNIAHLFNKNKDSETESIDEEIKKIYYVGGYDYKDYSE